jgi:hypothetical protein
VSARAIAGGFFVLASVVALAGACSTASDARIGVVTPVEDEANWHPVADYLDHRCGSIDCHGTSRRNFALWGCAGLRFDPDEAGLAPGCRAQGGTNTTDAEYDRTFRSVVGLEPAVMSAVEQGHGQEPELLTFIRKARGMESHKGGILVVPGDVQDQCMTSWLAGATDVDACTAGIAIAEGQSPPVTTTAGDAGP